MWNVAALFAGRHLISWLFEVLPVALLLLQSTVAVYNRGDVDGSRTAGHGLGAHGSGKLASLLGKWKVQEYIGMDKFLEELKFPRWQRALAARAGQQYVLQLKGGSSDGSSLDNATLVISTSDVRGKSELELPLSGRGVRARDGDGGAAVVRSARTLDDRTVEITERFPHDRNPCSVCTRTLTKDGRMLLEVKKRTPRGTMASMRALATRMSHLSA